MYQYLPRCSNKTHASSNLRK